MRCLREHVASHRSRRPAIGGRRNAFDAHEARRACVNPMEPGSFPLRLQLQIIRN
jgi:hypothetical protein